jgi:glycosyltransferase involved in cell wall biosynthesis
LGGHHVARALVAAGWDVAFISNPISPLHLLRPRNDFLGERLRLWRSSGETDLDGHLWAYVPGALVTPFNAIGLRSGFVDRSWHRMTVPPVARTARRHGFGEVDLLYIDTPVQSFWLRAIPHRVSVLRMGDYMKGFEAFTPSMQGSMVRAARDVDAVLYSAESLRSIVLALEPRRAIHLPNGVDFKSLSRASAGIPADVAEIAQPIAMYVGAMEAWFDFDLIEVAARRLPNVSFVLIGPAKHARARLPSLPNLHVLGTRPWEQLPEYLSAARVGMIPFDRASHPDLVDRIHPLKLYEYAARGVPIVATRWLELESLGAPIRLTEGADEFVAAIADAVTSTPDRAALIRFAESADWSARVERLLSDLGL